MKQTWKKTAAFVLAMALVVGAAPANVGTGGFFGGASITAYADVTETLLTTITATGKEQASFSTANVATVSFSYLPNCDSSYLANWGWWGYGDTAGQQLLPLLRDTPLPNAYSMTMQTVLLRIVKLLL